MNVIFTPNHVYHANVDSVNGTQRLTNCMDFRSIENVGTFNPEHPLRFTRGPAILASAVAFSLQNQESVGAKRNMPDNFVSQHVATVSQSLDLKVLSFCGLSHILVKYYIRQNFEITSKTITDPKKTTKCLFLCG